MKLYLLLAGLLVCATSFGQSYNWKPINQSSIHAPSPAGVVAALLCPTQEGCSGDPDVITAQVAAFTSCMANKVGVLIDAEAITYDQIEIPDAGTLFCWGYLHHPIARRVVPLD